MNEGGPGNWRRLAFGMGAALMLLGPLGAYLATEDTAVAALALVAAAAFTIVTRVDELAEISLGPLKARMRETIAEAAATLEQLREVATTTSTAVLTDLMAANFLESMTLSKRLELHDDIMASLDRIGASETQKARAEAEWKKGIGIIYHRAIRRAIRGNESLETQARETLAKDFGALLQFRDWRAPTPGEIERFLREKGCSSQEVQGWIDDYRYFLENNRIRNRDRFVEQ